MDSNSRKFTIYIIYLLPEVMYLEVRYSQEEHVVNVKDPSIFNITLEIAAATCKECTPFKCPLQVPLVLGGCHVFANVLYALLRDTIKSLDVVELNVDPPTLTVVFQANVYLTSLLSLMQNVPIRKC